MITTITTFKLKNAVSREEARDIFLSTAPKYRGATPKPCTRSHGASSSAASTAPSRA